MGMSLCLVQCITIQVTYLSSDSSNCLNIFSFKTPWIERNPRYFVSAKVGVQVTFFCQAQSGMEDEKSQVFHISGIKILLMLRIS